MIGGEYAEDRKIRIARGTNQKNRREPRIYPTSDILREVLFGKDNEMADNTSQDELRENSSPVRKGKGES